MPAARRAGRPAQCVGPGARAAIVQGDCPAARLAGKPVSQAGEPGIQPAGEQAGAVLGRDPHRGQDLDGSVAADAVPAGAACTADAVMASLPQ